MAEGNFPAVKQAKYFGSLPVSDIHGDQRELQYSEEELQRTEETAAAAENPALQCIVVLVGFLLFEQLIPFLIFLWP